jgi:hypothetical protein
MTPRVTRVLTATVLGTLALAASAWACDANKSAKATACAPGAKSTVTASSGAPARKAVVKQATPTARKAVPATAAKKSNPTDAGMRAYLDPETGTIGSLPLSGAIQPDGLPGDLEVVLTEMPLPNGRGWYIDTQGTMEEYSVLQLDAQGNRHMSCTKNPRAALKRAPVAPAPVARPEE